jgi:hypothetical protein
MAPSGIFLVQGHLCFITNLFQKCYTILYFMYFFFQQIALKYNKVTGVVDRSTTYEFGCYILGPSIGFVEFDAIAHTVSKSHGVFTLDKLPIEISYHVQYFIK